MSRMLGTVSMGVRAPIIRQGDDMVKIVTDCILDAMKYDGLQPRNRDIVAMTEAIVARAQGNYATVDNIASDVRAKLGGETVGVIFPILSRNRFAICLRGIAKGCKKVVLMLSYPSDEVGNHLIDLDMLDEKGVNPYSDVLSEEKYRELFGYTVHPFTGVDYVAYYKKLVEDCGAECEVIFANDCRAVLKHTKNVINCDIHTRVRTKRLLRAAGAERVCGLDDILTTSIDGSGWNARYGLLGSNKATEETVKLFPRDCQPVVDAIQEKLLKATGKKIFYINTHYPLNLDGCKKSSTLVEERIAALNTNKYPVIVVGDFNQTLSSGAFEGFKQSMRDARTYADECYSEDNKNIYTYNAFGDASAVRNKVDHIWYSHPALDAKYYETLTQEIRKYGEVDYLSDHYPITAVISF